MSRRPRQRATVLGSRRLRLHIEVYWDREWTMLQQGFDYAYDKRLDDRLREGHGRGA